MGISEYVNLYKTKQMYLINKTPLFTVSNTSFLHRNMKIFTVMQGHCHFQVNVLKFHLNLKELETGGKDSDNMFKHWTFQVVITLFVGGG